MPSASLVAAAAAAFAWIIYKRRSTACKILPSGAVDIENPTEDNLKAHWEDRWSPGQPLPPWKFAEKVQQYEKDYEWIVSHLGGAASARDQMKRVLVPLCGDAPIVGHLLAKGHHVTGIEYVPSAVERLKNSLGEKDWKVSKHDTHTLHEAADGSVSIWQGDVFAFRSSVPFDAIYDRAALVAIGPDNRERYLAVTLSCIRRGGTIYLETFERPNEPDAGPPFSVPPPQVARLLVPHAIQQIDHNPAAKTVPGRDWICHRFLLRKQ